MMDRRELLKSSLLSCGGVVAGGALGSWLPRAVLANDKPSSAPIVETSLGKLRGAFANGVYSFKGIHYGASTEGPMRFLPPSAPKPWTGMRDALEIGPPAPQDRDLAWWTPELRELFGGDGVVGPGQMSEDCLVLNVWNTGMRSNDKRPVMVWLHGGAHSAGSSGMALYDGTNLAAKHNVVVVGLNHRLNAFGYLYLGRIGGEKYADSGNVGMLDVVLALQWVRDNIAQFGGDPHNVTIFGESGGGWKVSTLMAMPAAKGLFHKAIVESGSQLRVRSPERADATAREFLAQFQVAPDHFDDLQRVPMKQFVAALHSKDLPWGPVLDGRSLLRHPFDPDAPSLNADVPMLIGTALEEARMLSIGDSALFSLSEADMRSKLKTFLQFADDLTPGTPAQPTSSQPLSDLKLDALIAVYRKNRPNASPSDIYFAVASDRWLRMDAITQAERKAAQHAAPVYMYLFEWQTPVLGGKLKATHTLELPFVFDDVDRAAGLIGRGADLQPLADKISGAWVAFARTGNPNHTGLPHWQAYDISNRATMMFNDECKVVNDPDRDERLALASLPPT